MDIILNPRPVGTIYGPSAKADPTTSLTAVGAKAITFNGLTADMTGVKIQVRLSDDGDWIAHSDVVTTAPAVMFTFPVAFNRARVIGLSAGVTVVAQG